MELQDGNLKSLFSNGDPGSEDFCQVAQLAFHHGLQALDHICSKGLVHRDIKPENFLYKRSDAKYVFLLGDFGLSNHITAARTCAGTMNYMAPEMFRKGLTQTHKVDVWGLYVTMLWTLNVKGLRQVLDRGKPIEEIHEAVMSAASNPKIASIREMANYDPANRPSAAQMLVKCFNGEGLTTPRNKVPTLVNPSIAIAIVEAPASAVSASTQTAPKFDGRIQGNARAGRSRNLGPPTGKQIRIRGVEKRLNKRPRPSTKLLSPIPGTFPEDT